MPTNVNVRVYCLIIPHLITFCTVSTLRHWCLMTTLRSLGLHDYENLLDISQACYLDLQAIPLAEAESNLLTDGSTLVINGVSQESWNSSNYPMSHHINTSLATKQISTGRRSNCSHSSPVLGKKTNE